MSAAASDRRVDTVVEQVGAVRPRLLDRWEATALIESFGYTDSRVSREFGLPDTLTLGTLVFDRMSSNPAPHTAIDTDDVEQEPPTTFVEAIARSLVYALPWLATFIAERAYPELLALPADAGPPLSLAIMFSLIVSGGFVQMISRRGQFYFAVKQPAVAATVCGYLFRAGVLTATAFAALAVVVGWYFRLFSGPYLVVAADQLIVLSALWLACAVLTVRRQHWRVPLAFCGGAAVFLVLRLIGIDALTAGLVASVAVLATAISQMPFVFGRMPAVGVPLPRFTVVAYRSLPYFWYGTVYFCFLFADRLTASAAAAAVADAPFGMQQHYKLGMDLSLLAFLFSAGIVEHANVRFSRGLEALVSDAREGRAALRRAVSRLHRRIALGAVLGYVPVAAAVIFIARALMPDEPAIVWSTALWGNAGYLLFAIALMNALVLFSLNDPWAAVKAIFFGLCVNLTVGAAMGHAVNTYFAAAGLLAGGLVAAAWSAGAVRDRLRVVDHAVATF